MRISIAILLASAVFAFGQGVLLKNPSYMASLKPAAAVGGAFTYYSALFDGTSDWLSRGADLTGMTDGDKFTLSVWVRAEANFTLIHFVRNEGGFFYVRRNTANILEVAGFNSAATQILSLTSGATQLDDDNAWHHVLVSCDLSQAAKSWIYLDGVDVTTRTTHTAGTMDLARGDWGVGARPDGSDKANALFCELYFTNEYIDISDSGNRAKFRDGSSKPVELGSNGSTPTGTAAILYLKSEVPNWESNAGTGGGMTENGTLVDGGSNKP